MFGADITEVISGSSGWVGTGLLGAILSWLMFIRLPANDKMVSDLVATKDKQIRDLLTEKDKQIDTILTQKWAAISELSRNNKDAIVELAKEFRGVTVAMGEHCDKEVERLVTVIEKYEKARPLYPTA